MPLSAQSKWQPELRVGLFKSTSTTLKFSLPIAIDNFKIEANVPIAASLDGGKLKLGDKLLEVKEIELRPKEDAQIREMITTIDGKKYPGTVKLVVGDKQLTVINLTTTDEYLRGVIPNEMPTSWNDEALKTQVLAARTFALKNRRRHSAEGYDLCSTTHCQVYGDLDTAVPSSDAAIDETFGEVLVFNGGLINAPFHSDSGGRTENASEVWGQHVPYLVSVDEKNSGHGVCRSDQKDRFGFRRIERDSTVETGDRTRRGRSIVVRQSEISARYRKQRRMQNHRRAVAKYIQVDEHAV